MKQTFNPNNPNIEWYDPASSKIDDNLFYGEVSYIGDEHQVLVGGTVMAESISVTIGQNELSTDSENLADPMIFTEEEVEAALQHNELEVSDNGTSQDDGVDYESAYFKGEFAIDPTAIIRNGIRVLNGVEVVTGSRLLYATEATITAMTDIQVVTFNKKQISVAFIKPSKAKKVFYPMTREQGLVLIFTSVKRINQLGGVQGIPALAAACHINGECGYGKLSGIGAFGNLGNFQFDVISNAKSINKKWPFIMKGRDTKPVDGKDISYTTVNPYHDDLDQALRNYIRWMYSSSRKYWKSFYSKFNGNPQVYIEQFMLDLAARGYFTGTVAISKEKWSNIVSSFVNQFEASDWEADFNLISSKLLQYFEANSPKLAAEMKSWNLVRNV